MSPLSAFYPLRYPAFRKMWLSIFLCNISFWMQMLTTIALVQQNAPGSLLVTWTQGLYVLPALIFTLLAGACADSFPPKALLLSAQGVMLVSNLCLIAVNGHELWLIGLLSLLAGISSAWRNPVWQSLISSLVPSHCLSEAVGLSSVNFNLARILGPFFASLFIVWLPLDNLFALCALLSLLFMWQVYTTDMDPPRREQPLALRHLLRHALRGFIHVYHCKEIKQVVVNTYWLSLISCSILLLIPTMAEASANAAFYTGLYLAFFGFGGISIVFIAPFLRSRYQHSTLLSIALLLQLFCSVNLLLFDALEMRVLMVTFSGAGWILMLTTLNSTLQHITPLELRGRSLSVYITCLSGGMSCGALLWGVLVKYLLIYHALMISAGIVAGALLYHFRASRWRA